MSSMLDVFVPFSPVNPTPTPAVVNVDNFVTKEAFAEEMKKFKKNLEEYYLKKNDLLDYIRLNRPLKWKYTWKGVKKYATLGKERLEVWKSGWKQWYPAYSNEGAESYTRNPDSD